MKVEKMMKGREKRYSSTEKMKIRVRFMKTNEITYDLVE